MRHLCPMKQNIISVCFHSKAETPLKFVKVTGERISYISHAACNIVIIIKSFV